VRDAAALTGAVAVIEVELTIVKLPTSTPSMRTAVALANALPVIVITFPPAAVPEEGDTEVTSGVIV
jgi:hypothetical protein